ncbi:universal stress protein [Rivularia sp. UHCC 0363]|uniref:universal stress protein n=1 Tax=Rivularia sp. UHCC 0363 TaxID=3110244 RepID=UPI002B21EE40|nr:universal stress protein [Rivularia sp. UHCC 0363]MEA5594328.1 universal stress protein [Rivularia sp. UHCC 0363]
MLKTIVAALDGSEMTERIIEFLGKLVLQKESKVVLCHVFAPPQSEMQLAADHPQNISEISYLQIEKQLEYYQQQLSIKSDLELVMGDPAEEITRLANIYQADLIVIGSRGLTGMNRIIQGSVSCQVTEDAHCSVLVVKP